MVDIRPPRRRGRAAEPGERIMPDSLSQAREDVAVANRILAHEGLLDAFGHVSIRHPAHAERFLISRHRAPELVQADDIVELGLDGEPAVPPNFRLYGERIIHATIYAARPDVMAICHHHAPPVMPYAIARAELLPVYHLGAVMGPKVPYWDSRDEFGDTALVLVTADEGRSLAKALGPYWMILMGRHGATVVGTSLRELLFRTVFSARNAELQTQAKMVGTVNPLTATEAAKAAAYNLRPAPMERAWDYWVMRLAKAEGRIAVAGAKPASAKPTRVRAAAKSKKPARAAAKTRQASKRRR
jgi:HCOMODA/2-hydroxy-3-carboxy-muconic semialdehyde decarboxylase